MIRSSPRHTDEEICREIKRAYEDSHSLYGSRKVWHQLRREGIAVAKCTVERLMRSMGLAGTARQEDSDHRQRS